MSNVTEGISQKIGRNLYLQENHPVKIVKDLVFSYFNDFEKKEDLNPEVDVYDNFDFLRIPEDHPGRSWNDTYYTKEDGSKVLRTHMTSYINKFAKDSVDNKYLICGDVYRKDTVDATHFPVFHQIDGFMMAKTDNPKEELVDILTGLIKHLFPGCEYRFSEDFFPFTDPSVECEVNFNGNWVEILGGGVIHHEIMDRLDMSGKKAIAFGLGIERLAMILFGIKDIRLFWSEDDRFLSQFKEGELTKFKPYSKYPAIKRDMSMWAPSEYHENDFYDLVRNLDVNNVIEDIELFDVFENPKKEGNNKSYAYHFTYRSLDKTLTDEEVTELHNQIASEVVNKMNVEIR